MLIFVTVAVPAMAWPLILALTVSGTALESQAGGDGILAAAQAGDERLD